MQLNRVKGQMCPYLSFLFKEKKKKGRKRNVKL